MGVPTISGTGHVPKLSGSGSVPQLTGTGTVPPIQTAVTVPDKSLDFDGVDEGIDLGNAPLTFDVGESFSMEFWVKRQNVSGNVILYSNRVAGNFSNTGMVVFVNDLRNGVTNNFQIIFQGTGGLYRAQSDTSVSSAWSHLVISYDGADATFYIDNVKVNTFVDTDTLSGSITSTYNAHLFVQPNLGGSFDGIANTARIFNSTLTVAEVNELYNGGDVLKISEFSGKSKCLASYRLGQSVWTGSKFRIIDSINGYNGTSINMEQVDLVDEIP